MLGCLTGSINTVTGPSQSSFCWLFLETKTWSGIMDLGGGGKGRCSLQLSSFAAEPNSRKKTDGGFICSVSSVPTKK